jgi:hypothetical protein
MIGFYFLFQETPSIIHKKRNTVPPEDAFEVTTFTQVLEIDGF